VYNSDEMKRLLTILILILTFQTPSQADDIRDFQIEGISIGDSLLDYLIKKKIEKDKIFYPDRKYFRAILFDNNDDNYPDSELFNTIFGVAKSGDKKYIIHSLEAFIPFENNIDGCLKKKKEILNDVSQLFPNAASTERKGKHPSDKTKKSIAYQVIYKILNQGYIEITCFDMSIESGQLDSLAVAIYTKKFDKYLKDEAFK